MSDDWGIMGQESEKRWRCDEEAEEAGGGQMQTTNGVGSLRVF